MDTYKRVYEEGDLKYDKMIVEGSCSTDHFYHYRVSDLKNLLDKYKDDDLIDFDVDRDGDFHGFTIYQKQ